MTTPTALQHSVVYDLDWRILPVQVDGAPKLYVLEFRDPVMRRWHEMFRGPTEASAEDAYDAFHAGEEPAGNEVWP